MGANEERSRLDPKRGDDGVPSLRVVSKGNTRLMISESQPLYISPRILYLESFLLC